MDNDQNSAGIAMSKFQADGARYFGLFDPHIPAGLTGNALLLSLGNPDCVAKAVGKNPGASYTVVDDVWTLDCLRALPPSEKMEFIEDLGVYNIIKGLDMKFDCIIMNPPYQKNLHLKVLAEAIKHLKDDGVCVNLSPVRWLQDPLAKEKKSTDYKRFEDSISKHLTDVEVINAKTANTIFGIQNFTDLAIYRCVEKSVCSFDYEHKLIDEYLGNRKSIFDKIFKFCKKSSLAGRIELNLKGISVKFNIHFGGHSNPYTLVSKNHSHPYIDGKTIDGRTYADCAFKKKDVDENKQEQSTIKFSSIIEAENFIKSVQTDFYMFVNSLTKRDVHVSLMALPWMGDAVNPRTGLKGYQGEWTDEDFYRYFELTDDEIKIVEDTMKKYAAK